MSDPMTNAEVEDILSSIRRLVSEEERAPAPKDALDKGGSDRLVLTPSLKVPPPVETQTDAMDMLEASSAVGTPEPAMPESAVSDVARSGEDADGVLSDGDLPDEIAGDAAVVEEPDAAETTDGTLSDAARMDEAAFEAALREAMASEDGASDDLVDAETGLTDDAGVPDEPTFSSQRYDAAAGAPEHAEPEEGCAAQEDEGSVPHVPEPDTDAMTEEDVIAEAPFIHAEPTDILQSWEKDTSADDAIEDAAGRPSSESRLRDKVAALEALVGRASGAYELDGAEAADAPAEEQTMPDVAVEEALHARADVDELVLASEIETLDATLDDEGAEETAETNAEPVSDAETGHTDDDVEGSPAEDAESDDAFVIDEASLREIVTEIVRQELQGALGERITRNVRNLCDGKSIAPSPRKTSIEAIISASVSGSVARERVDGIRMPHRSQDALN